MSGLIVIAFILGIVVTIVGFNLCAIYTHEREETQIPYLTQRRNEALDRVGQLRTYASYREQEAKCWPEDSSDRAELLAYASVARRQAEETLFRWREIERALRTERFEEITKRAQTPPGHYGPPSGHRP